MNILYDSNLTYGHEFFGDLGNATAFEAGKLTKEELKKVEILLTRSTTRVDAELIENAPKLRFLGTATAGIDHFDINEIEDQNIAWTHAPGCNARAVAEYICVALLNYAQRYNQDLAKSSIGIVGVGQVGSQVARMAIALNMKVVLYDPPRERVESDFESESFVSILDCDIISLHVPLTYGGDYETYHMFDEQVLARLSKQQLLINACRGEVIKTECLLEMSERPLLIFDCWEDEPKIDKDLLDICLIGTGHIAGHSLEGKAKGTESLYAQLCDFLGEPKEKHLRQFLPELKATPALLQALENIKQEGISHDRLYELCICFYDIENDDSFFRNYMAKSASITDYRRHYPVRREFDSIALDIQDKKAMSYLREFGFR